MRRNNGPVIGVILMLLGILLFFYDGKVDMSAWKVVVWVIPIALLTSGILLHILYFTRPYRNRSMLVPGGILITYSIVGFICTSNRSWDLAFTLWPLFPVGIAVGFIEYSLSRRNKNNVFIPLLMLIVVSVIFVFVNLNVFTNSNIISAALFIIGFIFIIKNKRKRLF
ncbi:hypothetical protein [Petroclostridium sp. X23]|uniref:hypothetical protein n=1 Tax=Petroclostridium sp. X23 TaxID=3045146 RepID=UPI0024AE0C9C|nr:hypothetical protein [Petroclostridium sp. X23]WHH57359.1 hypothetical protein QKW49_16165 [Petroclostridium sp. X23]